MSCLEGPEIGERLGPEDAVRLLGGDGACQQLLHPWDDVALGAVAQQRETVV
jgi:hypothetical protein